MASGGTTFEIDIPVDGSRAASAADSVKLLADQLDAASAASTAAADAVKVGETAYAQAEAAANRTAVALEKVTLAAQAQEGKIKAALDVGDMPAAERAKAKFDALTAKQADLAARATTAKAALDAEAATLDKLKGSAANASKAHEQIAATHAKVQAAAAASGKAAQAAAGSGKVNEIAEGLGKLGGPLGIAGQKALGAVEGFKKLGASVGAAGPYVAMAVVIAALAAGIGVLAIAAAGAAVKVTSWGISMADTARSSELLAAGIARSARGGDELIGKVDELLGKVPASKDELMGLAKTLADGGLRGKALGDALETAAIKAAKLKFGPDFEKEMISLPRQTARLQNNISKLFSGLKIEPFLTALDKLGDLFDQNNAAGRAIKVVFESMFQPLVDGATDTIPKLRTNFILAEIQILKGLIKLKLFTQQYGDELRFAGKAVAILTALIVGGLLLAIGFVIVNLIIIGAAFGFVVGVVLALVAGIGYLGAQLLALGVAANEAVIGKIKAAFDWLRSVSLADIGTAMIDGLVQGITAGAAKVTTALKGVVDGAVKGVKGALGIASPSKVFAEIGGYTAEGMEQGVSDGTDAVQSSISDMVAPPEAAASTAPAPAAKAGGEAGGGVTIIINGVTGAEDLLEQLSKLAMQLGGAVPA